MPYEIRPEIPEWPGHGCSKAFWEAPYRGAMIEFDQKLRRAEQTTKAALGKAIADRDAEATKRLTKDMVAIKDGKLPVERSRLQRTAQGVPLVAARGKTRPSDLMTPTRWLER